MFAKRICSISLALLAAVVCAQADTITIGPAADTWLQNNDTTAHGSDTFLYISDTTYGYAYLRFDLSSYNISDVQSATLSLWTAGNAVRNDNVVSTRFALNGLNDVAGNTPQNWDEATLTSATVGAEWTTNKRPLVNTTVMDADIAGSGMTEKITLVGAFYYSPGGITIVVSGGPLAQFIKSRCTDAKDTGLVTLIVDFGVSTTGRGYGIVSKEGTTAEWRPVLTLTATVGPKTAASKPSPADKATEVSRDVVLSWSAGQNASTHKVYFGTNLSDVNAGSAGVLVAQTQDTTYDPVGVLPYGTTYYWRVDEVEQNGTVHPGSVWSFTTEAAVYPIASANITAQASSNDTNKGPQNTVNGSGLDATGLLHSTTDAGAMWLSSRAGAQPTWIQYSFDRVYKLTDMWVWNYNNDYETLLGMGIKNAKIEYSSDGTTWNTLGNFDFAQAPAAANYAHNTTINLGGVPAKAVKITVNSGFGVSGQYGLSEVRFFYIPVVAQTPSPANNATGVLPNVTLSWRAGREAASHNVYLGTDPNALTPAGTVSTNSYAPANLSLGTRYYWRVDEVNAAATPSTWTGDVWNFTTPDFLAVDDMESYNDKNGTRIFDMWLDGYDTPSTNGSVVGYGTAVNGTFAETTIIHGGKQSMPFAYNNATAPLSEATRTFDTAQDWTAAGIKTLVIFFRGDPANAAAQLCVKINGTKVNYSGSSAGLAAPIWKQWNIDLASVSGVSLKAVKTLTIGVTGSGKGTLYFDDIRLYKSAPAVATPADPGTTGLMAYYAMEGDAKDSKGGYNGTLNNVTFAASMAGFGQAAQFNGTTGYIDLGAAFGNLVSALNSATVSVWVNYGTVVTSWQRVLDFGNGGTTPTVYMFMTTRNASNLPRFAYTTTGTAGEVIATGTSTPSAGWHHLVGVVDAATMKAALYVDGTLGQGGVNATILPKDLGKTTQNWLGRSGFTADPYLTGAIDELRIFNRALSEGEIRYLAGDR